mgnify:FL=1
MNNDQTIAISMSLQQLAQEVDDFLALRAGERVPFTITLQIGGVAQYVSNCARSDGAQMIRDLLARWEANRADIPAHYNPDLRP